MWCWLEFLIHSICSCEVGVNFLYSPLGQTNRTPSLNISYINYSQNQSTVFSLLSSGGVWRFEAWDPSSGGGYSVPKQPTGGCRPAKRDFWASAIGGPGNHQDWAWTESIAEERAFPLHEHWRHSLQQVINHKQNCGRLQQTLWWSLNDTAFSPFQPT